MDNCVSITKRLLRLFKIRYTNEYLEDYILSHPDHPSLLSISDTLNTYKIENLAIKTDKNKFDELPLPCIVQVSRIGKDLFYLLKAISDKKVSYYDDKGKMHHIAKDAFLNAWTGVCLLAEKLSSSKEESIEGKLIAKRFLNFLKVSMVLLLMTWVSMQLFLAETVDNTFALLTIGLYTFLKFLGLGVGLLLLWFEVDEYNPTLQNICSGGAKVNCRSVLNSKYAQLFNGNLSLSLAGFSYFFGSLLYPIIQGFSMSALALSSIISFLGFPIVLISLYYQAVVIKQWCKLCVMMQTVIIFEILVSFLGGFYTAEIALETIPLLVALFILPIIAWKLIKSLLQKEKERNFYKRGFKKIKNNADVLMGLLVKSRRFTASTEGLGIQLKNTYAKYNIVKVCNPYCGPCAKAHPILEELFAKERINLQILFTARANGNDPKTIMVRHFLAINQKGPIREALDYWYNSDTKDYGAFSKRYPMNGELENQNDEIEAMGKWCDSENVAYTPTLFINGYELPKEYSIADLKEVLS
jgi:uncharacterized membrane protein/thiol-disulfide isomerase/thioredoxin